MCGGLEVIERQSPGRRPAEVGVSKAPYRANVTDR